MVGLRIGNVFWKDAGSLPEMASTLAREVNKFREASSLGDHSVKYKSLPRKNQVWTIYVKPLYVVDSNTPALSEQRTK